MDRPPTPSDEQQAAEALNAYVERLLSDRAAELPAGVDRAELAAYLLATKLAGERPNADRPPAAVLARLEERLRRSLADHEQGERRARARQALLSRRHGLAAAASLAAGARMVVLLIPHDAQLNDAKMAAELGRFHLAPEQVDLDRPRRELIDQAARLGLETIDLLPALSVRADRARLHPQPRRRRRHREHPLHRD